MLIRCGTGAHPVIAVDLEAFAARNNPAGEVPEVLEYRIPNRGF